MIKIYKNSIEVDFVKQSLSVVKENNAFINEFKVAHSSFPFLIIENEKTKQLLGSRDLTSIDKPKVVTVTVDEGGKMYYGELQILSYISGFRKCNLKYASELLKILDKEVQQFMPVISIIPGVTAPAPFVKESLEIIPGYQHWKTFPVPFLDKTFPEVKFQFPTMYWPLKFGDDVAETEWFAWPFAKEINHFNNELTEFADNFYEDQLGGLPQILNRNVPSPQVFLLSILYYAFKSIGFTIHGDFVESDFVKRLLVFSKEDNLTKVNLSDGGDSVFLDLPFIPLSFSTYAFYKYKNHPITGTGTYVITFKFTYGASFYNKRVTLKASNPNGASETLFSKKIFDSTTLEGSVEMHAEEVGNLVFVYYTDIDQMPVSYTLTVALKQEIIYQEMHPTIELGRYVPAWSVGKCMNECKKLFNLKIVVNDFSKKVHLDFVEKFIKEGSSVDLNKSLKVQDYELSAHDSYHLKYENDTDKSFWITKSGIEAFAMQKSDFTQQIASNFKLMQLNDYTAYITDEFNEKNGVALMIYNPESRPYVAPDFQGQTLDLKDLHKNYYKITLKLRLNSSSLTISGPFDEKIYKDIDDLQKVYIDHQEFIVLSTERNETATGILNVKLKLESVNI